MRKMAVTMQWRRECRIRDSHAPLLRSSASRPNSIRVLSRDWCSRPPSWPPPICGCGEVRSFTGWEIPAL